PRADESPGAGARHPDALGRPVGHLGGGLFAGGGGRLSGQDFRQGNREDRSHGGGVLEGALRPVLYTQAGLEDPGAQAPRQAQALRGRGGQLLPERRGVSGGGVPEDGGSAGGG